MVAGPMVLFPCGSCFYCPFIDNSANISLPNWKTFRPKHYANCRTQCEWECGCFYIGKTIHVCTSTSPAYAKKTQKYRLVIAWPQYTHNLILGFFFLCLTVSTPTPGVAISTKSSYKENQGGSTALMPPHHQARKKPSPWHTGLTFFSVSC